MKTCPKCKIAKPLTDFHRNCRSKDGAATYCKPCALAKVQAWRERDPERTRRLRRESAQRHPAANRARQRKHVAKDPQATATRLREWQLKKKYNLTIAQWEAIFNGQGRVCAVCGAPEPGTTRSRNGHGWHTDHCHKTGRTRGILCHHCNVALGNVKDSPETLLRLYSYLCAELVGPINTHYENGGSQ